MRYDRTCRPDQDIAKLYPDGPTQATIVTLVDGEITIWNPGCWYYTEQTYHALMFSRLDPFQPESALQIENLTARMMGFP